MTVNAEKARYTEGRRESESDVRLFVQSLFTRFEDGTHTGEQNTKTSTKLKAHTPKLSLVPQRLEGVDFHRPPGWKVTSQERHRNQPHRHKSKSSYVSRRHFKQQSPHQPRQTKRTDESKSNTDQRQRHAVTQHHLQHISRTCTERHANANFLRPLRHRVTDHAIDPDRRQQ